MRCVGPSAPGDERTGLRLVFLAAAMASALVVLVARLWYVQIAAGARYDAQAERGRIRTLQLEAPRGRIVDRDGHVLVDNREVHVIGVRPEEMGADRQRVLADLARLLGTSVDELERRLAGAADDPLRPVTVAFDVPERIALFVWAHQSTRFPGVHAELLPRRSYPERDLAAHVVGWVGEITGEQLAQPAYSGYQPGVQVGMAGVERVHERALQGTPGWRRVEVDATGALARQTGERSPTPGADVQLTLDRDVQRLAESVLTSEIARARRRLADQPATTAGDGATADGGDAATGGAVVVLDPHTGDVLALASAPTYSPAAFVGGIDAETYARWTDPASNGPLIDRAVQSALPPGSVFKPVTTAAALRHDAVGADDALACPPRWRWGPGSRVFRNWTPEHEGRLTLVDALARSCDTIYYTLAQRMWREAERRGLDEGFVTAEARRFGYGSALGVDLPGEHDGVVPGRRWRREAWQDRREITCAQARGATDAQRRALLSELCGPAGGRWRGGDAVNLSIGQGDLLATPLQVATATAAIANGGTLWRPRVAAAIRRPDGSVAELPTRRRGRVDLDPETLGVLRTGLQQTTRGAGTAADAFVGSAVPVAGKTGTAESPPGHPHAWFAAYAPADEPRWVVVAVIEHGGSGSAAAAPLVRTVIDGLAGIAGR